MKKITVSLIIALLFIAPLAYADALEDAIKRIPPPKTSVGLCSGWNDKSNEKCGGVKEEVITETQSTESQNKEISSAKVVSPTKPVNTSKKEEGKVLGALTNDPSAYNLLKKEIDALQLRLAATEEPKPFDWTPYWLLAFILAVTSQNEWRLRQVFKKVTIIQGQKKQKVTKKS